jgi:hypothetical protein
MNEGQLIYISNWEVELYDFRPKDLSKKRKLSIITDDAVDADDVDDADDADDVDDEPPECKRLKFND